MALRLFGTSGVRRLVKDLSDDFVRRLALSLAAYSDDSVVAVGRDTRPSSSRLSSLFCSALLDAGKDVVDLGVAATPTVALASGEYGTGVVVTASHNPPEYNGFKFWVDALAYSPEQERQLEDLFFSGVVSVGGAERGSLTELDYSRKHIEKILEKVGVVSKGVRVLVDCANGAGVKITPKLLEEMGCDVLAVNTETKGFFVHGLEPTAENLKGTCSLVKEAGVDVGLVHDGDADRSAAIDSSGRLVDWDNLLAALAYGKKRVVTTVDASMRIEEVCDEVVRTKIGDVAVADAVNRLGADFGGEPSGSMIFPEVHLFPDGPLTAAVVAKMVSDDRFYEVLKEIHEYPMRRLKIFYGERVDLGCLMDKIRSSLLNEFSEVAEVNEVDGIRLSLGYGWVLVRPSGTEPCVRVTAEAESEAKLQEVVDRSSRCVRESL